MSKTAKSAKINTNKVSRADGDADPLTVKKAIQSLVVKINTYYFFFSTVQGIYIATISSSILKTKTPARKNPVIISIRTAVKHLGADL